MQNLNIYIALFMFAFRINRRDKIKASVKISTLGINQEDGSSGA